MDKFERMDEKHKQLIEMEKEFKRAIDKLTYTRMRFEEAKAVHNKAVREEENTTATRENVAKAEQAYNDARDDYTFTEHDYWTMARTSYEDR